MGMVLVSLVSLVISFPNIHRHVEFRIYAQACNFCIHGKQWNASSGTPAALPRSSPALALIGLLLASDDRRILLVAI